MSTLFIVASIVYIVLCVGLIVLVLAQKKRQGGLGAGLTGAGAESGGSFYSKNKGNTLEGRLEKYTKIAGALFLLFSLALGLLA